MQKLTVDNIKAALKTIIYPATRKDILTSNIVKDIALVDENTAQITLNFPRQTDPHKLSIEKSIQATIHNTLSNNIKVELLSTYNTTPKQEEQPLQQVKNIIAVSSGKGGVGKSTISVNLAIALQRLGNSVGILDTDLFGPSIPKMLGVENQQVYAEEVNGKQLITPVEKYGIKVQSIGFFISKDTATLWRGAMSTNVLRQLITDTNFGTLDYLILDTPPGTSDIHLTLLQTIPITGAIIVSTPQEVALADARKGIDMYQNDKVNVPILGLVENMAYFTPAEMPQNKYYIFGKEGCKKLAQELHIPLLAQIPITLSLCESGDKGIPEVLNNNSPTALALITLAQTIATIVRRRNAKLPPTQIVTTQ